MKLGLRGYLCCLCLLQVPRVISDQDLSYVYDEYNAYSYDSDGDTFFQDTPNGGGTLRTLASDCEVSAGGQAQVTSTFCPISC